MHDPTRLLRRAETDFAKLIEAHEAANRRAFAELNAKIAEDNFARRADEVIAAQNRMAADAARVTAWSQAPALLQAFAHDPIRAFESKGVACPLR